MVKKVAAVKTTKTKKVIPKKETISENKQVTAEYTTVYTDDKGLQQVNIDFTKLSKIIKDLRV